MIDAGYIIKEFRAGKSPYQIAEELNAKGLKCYPNLVRRTLIKYGEPLRNKSNAQANSLKQGRTNHPTKGRKRTQEEKISIGKGISEAWENLTEEELSRRKQISKDRWDNMTVAEKENLRSASAKAIREAAENGSKIEKFLLYQLRKLGYRVDFHSTSLLSTQKLQVDLFLPDLGTAIEVDGLSHFEPVWGEEALEKRKWSDQEKNGLLLGRGYCVIRLKATANNVSIAYQQKLLDKLIPVLDNIRRNKGILPIEKRLIYIDE